MRCIIIGDGPSRSLLKNVPKDVDIFCIHYTDRTDCKAVLSLDLLQYNRKEKIMLERGVPLILSETSCHGDLKKNLTERGVTFFKPLRMQGNSGAFAIEWAVSQGYTTIYTAGIDFFCDEGEYINPILLRTINNYVAELIENDIQIYKISAASKLECPVSKNFKN